MWVKPSTGLGIKGTVFTNGFWWWGLFSATESDVPAGTRIRLRKTSPSLVSHEGSGRLLAIFFLVAKDTECYFFGFSKYSLQFLITYYEVNVCFRLWSKLTWLLLAQDHFSCLNRADKIWNLKNKGTQGRGGWQFPKTFTHNPGGRCDLSWLGTLANWKWKYFRTSISAEVWHLEPKPDTPTF